MSRRRLLTTVGTTAITATAAGCTTSSDVASDRSIETIPMEEALEFEAEEGAEISVSISARTSDFGRANLYGPNGGTLAELSFNAARGGSDRDSETVTAPSSGTYVLQNEDTSVTASIQVDGEAPLD